MHKKAAKRTVFGSASQKVKASQYLPHIKNNKNDQEERNGHVLLPSLQRRKSWKYDSSSYGRTSTTTIASWSEGVEQVVVSKLVQEWNAIESFLYEESKDIPRESLAQECTQWKTQILHFRVVGKGLTPLKLENPPEKNKVIGNLPTTQEEKDTDDKVLSDCSLAVKGKGNYPKSESQANIYEEILNALTEYVCSELTPGWKDKDSWSENISGISKVSPSLISEGTNSIRSSKTIYDLEDGCSGRRINLQTNKVDTLKETYGKTKNSDIENWQILCNNRKQKEWDKAKNKDDEKRKDGLCTPQIYRNKLGTLFNERVIVSPVPFVVSTRESFSTVRTTPIKFVERASGTSYKIAERNITSGLRMPGRRSIATIASNMHSGWQAPVCPTVCPKNVKLAPIDLSRLPSSKSRSSAPSPAPLQLNRKPLSPISRSTTSATANTVRDEEKPLEIRGKHIIPCRSPKVNALSAGLERNPRLNIQKKNARQK